MEVEKEKEKEFRKLNDSIGSEFFEDEEKSVYEKITDQNNRTNLYNSLNFDFKRNLNLRHLTNRTNASNATNQSKFSNISNKISLRNGKNLFSYNFRINWDIFEKRRLEL